MIDLIIKYFITILPIDKWKNQNIKKERVKCLSDMTIKLAVMIHIFKCYNEIRCNEAKSTMMS